MKILFMSMSVHDSIQSPGMHHTPMVGMYLLTSVLREAGHDVQVLDPMVILENRYNFGEESSFNTIMTMVDAASVICISSTTLNWSTNLETIKKIKKNSNKPIVLGGIHPTHAYKYIMESTDVDFIIRGEGEYTLPQLITSISKNYGFEEIDGLSWRDIYGDIIHNKDATPLATEDYSQFPLPAYDLMPKDVYVSIPLEASRGCKFACAFCSIPRKNNWVRYEEEYALNRVDSIIDKFGNCFMTKLAIFGDDCFTAIPKRATRLLDYITKKHQEYDFLIEARANDLRKENSEQLIEVMGRPQIFRIASGVEAGYNKGLNKVRKGITIEQLEEYVEKMHKNGIARRCYLTFIIGFPWETVDDMRSTIHFAAKIEKNFGPGIVNVNWLIPMPSSLWDQLKENDPKVTDEIFDYHNYMDRNLFFFQTHPNVKPSDVSLCSKLIQYYEDRNIRLRNP